MPETLATADGAALDVGPAADAQPDDKWVEHMREASRAADESEHPAPPKTDPEAPYGRKPDGTPRKRPGRPPKDDTASKPRTQKRSRASRVAQTTTASAGPKDYRPQLHETLSGLWGVACLGSQADAGALLVFRPALVQNVNAAAQQSAMCGRIVDAVTGYTVVGVAAGTLLMLGLQLAANHKRVDVKAVAHLGIRSSEELAAINVEEMVRLGEEMKAAQEAAQEAA